MISSSFSATFSFGSSYAASAPVTITYDPYFSSVYALLQGEGPNGSTVIVDSSTNSNAVTVTSPTALSSTRSKFGSTSVYTGVAYGSGTFTIDLGSAFLAKDYTMEMWIYYTGTDGGAQWLMQFSSTRNWQITPSGYLSYYSDNYPLGTVQFSHQTPVTANTWSHIALVKSNNVLAIYLNGVKSTTTPTEAEIRNVLTTVSNFDMPGNINGYRLTKDFARYTTDFTPPSAAFYAIGPTDPYYNNVSLLLHGTGANASTTVLDSSVAPKALTVSGSAQISTTQYKFNNSSMYFSGGYITSNTSADYQFGTGDFTLETWVYLTTTGTGQLILDQTPVGGPNALRISYSVSVLNKISVYDPVAGSISSTTSPTINTWYHVACCRTAGQLKLYINGIQEASVASTTDLTSNIFIIGTNGYALGNSSFSGYLDEIRVTKGVARYTTNFTVPSVAYPSQGPTDAYYSNVSLLLHGNGTNGSTTFTDNSPTPKSVSVSGNTAISTTQFKYGAASMYFNNSVATVTSSTDFQFGTGDFTIEFWMYPTSLPSVGAIITDNGSFYIALESNGRVSMVIGGVSLNAGLVSANTWSHIAFSKSSSVLKSFTNGILNNSVSNTATNNITGNLTLGQYSGVWQYPGYIDDLRITKGTGRYTANFTVPAAPFPNQGPTDAYYANVALLLHGDGTNGSTTVTDNSSTTKTVTAYGNAQVSTTQLKYGSASMYFDGTGDYFSTPTSADFDFASGDFTMEFWYYPTTITAGAGIVGPWVSSGWLIAHPNPAQAGSPPAASLRFVASTGNSYAANTVDIYGTGTGSTISANVWTHLCVVRSSGVFKLFLNGTMLTTTAIGTQASSGLMTIYNNGLPLKIGENVTGYIDDMRITKGVARYTSSFTPPAAPFPNS